MALMMGSFYDALRSGGIEDDKARKAAEEVAGYENRLAPIESRLGCSRGWSASTSPSRSVFF